MTQRELERTLLRFEGLIHETARQIVAGGVEMEFDDVRQRLRIKVWRAVVRWDETHRRGLPLRRFVFCCVANERKDIEKRPRRFTASIDGIRERPPVESTTAAADWFDARYLSVDAEQVFAEVDEAGFELPSTLTPIERRVVELRIEGLMLREIDGELGLSRAQRESVMRSLRAKLADWRPTQAAVSSVLPAAETPRVPIAA